MEIPFTEEQLELLDGKYPGLANSLGVSDTYLKGIARGKKPVKSELSKKCLKKLQKAVQLFTPEETA